MMIVIIQTELKTGDIIKVEVITYHLGINTQVNSHRLVIQHQATNTDQRDIQTGQEYIPLILIKTIYQTIEILRNIQTVVATGHHRIDSTIRNLVTQDPVGQDLEQLQENQGQGTPDLIHTINQQLGNIHRHLHKDISHKINIPHRITTIRIETVMITTDLGVVERVDVQEILDTIDLDLILVVITRMEEIDILVEVILVGHILKIINLHRKDFTKVL